MVLKRARVKRCPSSKAISSEIKTPWHRLEPKGETGYVETREGDCVREMQGARATSGHGGHERVAEDVLRKKLRRTEGAEDEAEESQEHRGKLKAEPTAPGHMVAIAPAAH